jgi:hypothetical protein
MSRGLSPPHGSSQPCTQYSSVAGPKYWNLRITLHSENPKNLLFTCSIFIHIYFLESYFNNHAFMNHLIIMNRLYANTNTLWKSKSVSYNKKINKENSNDFHFLTLSHDWLYRHLTSHNCPAFIRYTILFSWAVFWKRLCPSIDAQWKK